MTRRSARCSEMMLERTRYGLDPGLVSLRAARSWASRTCTLFDLGRSFFTTTVDLVGFFMV